MPAVRDSAASGAPRLLRALLVAAAAAAATLLPGAVAAADEPAGTSVTGRLVQAWAEAHPDDATGQASDGPVAWVQPADGDAVPVDPAAVAEVPTGATVELTVGSETGDTDDADATLEVLEKDVTALPTVAPVLRDPAGLTNRVTVVLVQPAGAAPDGVTEAEVVDAVNGPVADFWSEQSNGAVQVGVTASRGWTATTAGCADAGALWNEVAATVGFVPGAGNHLLVYVSGAAPGCAYALAEVGAAPSTGGQFYVQTTSPSAIVHEFGHNFGLGHSSIEQCDGVVEGGSCRTVPYGDYYDVMGVSWSQTGTLNAAQAALLGVLPAAQQQELSVQGSATTATLSPLSGRSGTRALRLIDADGVDYWLEYRTATGQDGWLSSANRYGLDAGVLLRRVDSMPDTSVLLDGTPGPAAGWDGDHRTALPVGVAVPVSGGDFSVVVQSVSAAGAIVSVTPSPPSTGQERATPEPQRAPGGVMSGTRTVDAAEPNAVAAPQQLWAPNHGRAPVVRTAPALAAVVDSTNDPAIPALAAGVALMALVATSLLLARRLRTASLRTR